METSVTNGHVENHKMVSNNNNRSPEPGSMEDTVEYRLMMAYAQRRRPKKKEDEKVNAQTKPLNGSADENGTTPSQAKPEAGKQEVKKKKKKKRFGRRLLSIFSCVKPQTEEAEAPQGAAAVEDKDDEDDVNNRCFFPGQVPPDSVEDDHEISDLAARVIEVVEELEFTTSDVEEDSKEDDVERMVGLLLREEGDQLAKKFKDAKLGWELLLNYNTFRMVIQTFLEKIGFRSRDPNALGPQASPKTQIAVACEITSRLSAMDTLPTNRLLDHGARFLQEDYSAWAQQQGGYEAAFQDDEVD
ncbi:apoptosis facilitator Bcl-2-like protein 14 [Kryptolebias marmoratus]|uniref:apoptosis facilitator Bcl-2-like protein 14 n=1 Tax=Kryptolebias marmoratus TaxID=37003 RepID=UPI0007F8A324|nr:apoptosis facilitator Bcl-2-like protein 14 [Kryptolebias marmoratus]